MKYLLVLSSRELAIIESCVNQAVQICALATSADRTFDRELEAFLGELRKRPQAMTGFEISKGDIGDIDA